MVDSRPPIVTQPRPASSLEPELFGPLPQLRGSQACFTTNSHPTTHRLFFFKFIILHFHLGYLFFKNILGIKITSFNLPFPSSKSSHVICNDIFQMTKLRLRATFKSFFSEVYDYIQAVSHLHNTSCLILSSQKVSSSQEPRHTSAGHCEHRLFPFQSILCASTVSPSPLFN